MVWRGDIELHNKNVDRTFMVMTLVDEDDTETKNALRAIIVKELKLCCQCIIDWLDDENNENCELASEFIENLDQEYDVCVIIDAQNFIYKLLGKPLSELLNVE